MIGYNCKYAPVEILAGFGAQCELMNNEAANFDYAAGRLHPNMCSHAKAMLEEIHTGNYNELLFMNCCDSSRRIFDASKDENIRFSYCIDLPSCGNHCAVERFKDDILGFIDQYEKYSGKSFDKKQFLSAFQGKQNLPQNKFIAILGARSNKTLLNVAKSCFSGINILDLTCASNREVLPIDADENASLDELMLKYAKALMAQTPCMRMQDIKSREALLENENCVGIIYSTIKFCDYYDFEFSKLKNLKMPMIRIETDFTNQSYGQLLTRLEGFAETINKTDNKRKNLNMNGKYFVGIDSGSTSTELVAMDKDLNIVKTVMVRTGANAGVGAKNALNQAGIDKKDIALIVATGYGRKNIDFADDNVTEITCHAKGAKHLYPDVKTIIDIGGQDSKVISLDENGKVVGFVMNDKCAAGTGRFLENMAKVLELDMPDMANVGLNYKNDLTISSMCTVFAESEVVSLIAENHTVADIVHGLNKSVATKTKALANSAKDKGAVMMTGGVANNKGVVSELEKQLNTKIFIPEHPEFCGALGAALIAAENR
ncbi:MAG: acyl-CoA dehydratase activase [Eubacterium sp.]|nr:acyl-CoA dehydratase activase [Eubacterium sp.]